MCSLPSNQLDIFILCTFYFCTTGVMTPMPPLPYFTEVFISETRENMVVSSSNSGDSYTAQEGFFTSLADRTQGTKLSSPDATRLH